MRYARTPVRTCWASCSGPQRPLSGTGVLWVLSGAHRYVMMSSVTSWQSASPLLGCCAVVVALVRRMLCASINMEWKMNFFWKNEFGRSIWILVVGRFLEPFERSGRQRMWRRNRYHTWQRLWDWQQRTPCNVVSCRQQVGIPTLLLSRWLHLLMQDSLSNIFWERRHANPNPRAEAPIFLSPTFQVSMKVRTIPSSSARSVGSSAPSRTTAARKCAVSFGFTTGLASMFFSQSPTFTTSWLCTMMNLQPVHYIEPTSLLKTLYHHLDWAVTIILLVCHELERIDQVVTDSIWRRMCSKHLCFSAVGGVLHDQDSVRGLAIVLAAARRTPPIALLLSVSSRDPPDGIFQRVSVARRAYIRQGDPSLSFNWHSGSGPYTVQCRVIVIVDNKWEFQQSSCHEDCTFWCKTREQHAERPIKLTCLRLCRMTFVHRLRLRKGRHVQICWLHTLQWCGLTLQVCQLILVQPQQCVNSVAWEMRSAPSYSCTNTALWCTSARRSCQVLRDVRTIALEIRHRVDVPVAGSFK